MEFLVALEYRRTLNPAFKVFFSQVEPESDTVHLKETYNRNDLTLEFEDSNGKHYRDKCPDTHVSFTLPELFDMPLWCGFAPIRSTMNDTYVLGHEFGHAAHDMLGINAPRTSFNRHIANNFMRNTFFPLIDRVQRDYMGQLVPALKTMIQQGISSRKYKNEADYFAEKLQDIKSIYTKNKLQEDVKEAEISGIAALEKAIADKQIDDEFHVNAVKLQMKQKAFSVWTNPEELFRIAGISFYNGYIFVHRGSDLNLFVECLVPFRTAHIMDDEKLLAEDKTPLSSLDFAPSANYIAGLFYLHGYDFEKYKADLIQKQRSGRKTSFFD
ncbi:hypothetical protein FACS189449_09450 [Alphaproteobacteria bacterium]|nr:hypothetical protein FACS189449_09450 [Alphaproteobacteria bacterium]